MFSQEEIGVILESLKSQGAGTCSAEHALIEKLEDKSFCDRLVELSRERFSSSDPYQGELYVAFEHGFGAEWPEVWGEDRVGGMLPHEGVPQMFTSVEAAIECAGNHDLCVDDFEVCRLIPVPLDTPMIDKLNAFREEAQC